jgi:Transposase DDE domain group 1
MQTLALHGHPARRWEPKRLRTRLFTIPATLVRTAGLLHLADHHPWATAVQDAVSRLRDLIAAPTAAPG